MLAPRSDEKGRPEIPARRLFLLFIVRFAIKLSRTAIARAHVFHSEQKSDNLKPQKKSSKRQPTGRQSSSVVVDNLTDDDRDV